MISWRNAAIVLAVVCCVQRWQSCTRSESSSTKTTVVEHTRTIETGTEAFAHAALDEVVPTKGATKTFHGIRIPAWAQRLLPQPGEKLTDYRDRIIPLAQLAIAPQRARVARMRDKFDDKQRTELDAAATEAATAIENRVATAIMSGELASMKPMAGVAIARDVLDIVDRGNTKFASSLTPEQAQHFDFADYLVFSTPWEDALTTKR